MAIDCVPDDDGSLSTNFSAKEAAELNGNCRVFHNVADLNDAMCQQWCEVAEQAVRDRGSFHVALAGGSTPRQFYQRLAQCCSPDMPVWLSTHFYFGDERCVPLDDEHSNYRMAHESLLSQLPLKPDQVHAMYDPSLSAEQCAERYAKLLTEQMSLSDARQPVFDLVLLGMGEDGHTASLFPETEILAEMHRSVAAQYVEKLRAWRISLTLPVINAARHVAVLVVGEAKAEVLAQVAKEYVPPIYPIQQVRPQGRLDWYVDEAAAAQLPPGLCS